MTMLFSFPVNDTFWNSNGPVLLGGFALEVFVVIAVVVGLTQLHRLGVNRKYQTPVVIISIIFAFLILNNSLSPIARSIETEAGFIGGLGLPVYLGWAVGGVLAAIIAYLIGKTCLGLRSDYLAIATLGFAEIIKAVLKNADWLTRGTLTVSPLPWPVPTPNDIGFVAARALYLSLTAVMVVIIFILLQRAYQAPWGRMMRTIRDNETAAAAMGKDVNFRRLEIFVFGSALMGIGGAVLVTFSRIFDPSGFAPLHHTFIVWVMVILGGAGNNLGAIFGAVAIYIIWTMAEPVTLVLFSLVSEFGVAWFNWEPPSDLMSRALQMRVFIIGLTITLALRFVPRGLIPERVTKIS